MREVFKPRSDPRDPGRVFYTIRLEDIGKTVIQTEIGPIHVTDSIGRVYKFDVGKRLYRVPNNDGDWWYWQIENDAQFARRELQELNGREGRS